MKIKYLIIVSILMSTINLSTASNPYGEIYTYDVYYNDKLLPGTDVAKPILKIGEPFDIEVNMTVYQEYKVSGKLTELGEGYFEVINGPSKMDQYSSIILKLTFRRCPFNFHNFFLLLFFLKTALLFKHMFSKCPTIFNLLPSLKTSNLHFSKLQLR